MIANRFRLASIFVFSSTLAGSGIFYAIQSNGQKVPTAPGKIFAQKLIEETLAAHPEIAGAEIATTPSQKHECVTIASSEPQEIGEKCDKDEFTVLATNEPFVEKEKENGQEVYDVTIPIHTSDGKTICTAGIDFKPGPAQQKAKIVEQALQIGKELESKIGSKEKLFEPVS